MRQAPAVYTATNLGYESVTAETIDADMDIDGGQIDSRAINNGKRKETKATVESLKKKAKKTLAEMVGKTPERKQEIMEESLVRTHVGGMVDLKTRIEQSMTPARRLFINYCSRATGNARDRIRIALEYNTLSKSATIRKDRGVVPSDSVPSRFHEEPARTALMAAIEAEWAATSALQNQYESCVKACEDGYALSHHDKMFWGRARTRALGTIGTEGGVPDGVLGFRPSSEQTDPQYLCRLVQKVASSNFETAERTDRERLQHTFGEYTVEHPTTLPTISKKQRELDLEK